LSPLTVGRTSCLPKQCLPPPLLLGLTGFSPLALFLAPPSRRISQNFKYEKVAESAQPPSWRWWEPEYHSKNGMAYGILNAMHIAHRFEHLLNSHRRPDGRRWTGRQLDDATGGVVTRSYVTNLRKGRIESPGYEKMRAIAKAMGFPPELWFEEDLGSAGEVPAEQLGGGISSRLEHFFEAIRNPKSGEPYTNAEVARISAGDLTEAEVEGIRGGEIGDPLVSHVVALAAAFGIPPSCLLDRGREPAVLHEEVLEALADETAGAILKESARLPEREKRSSWG
jgi:transcriptional regulator with XRE-family HTH domain